MCIVVLRSLKLSELLKIMLYSASMIFFCEIPFEMLMEIDLKSFHFKMYEKLVYLKTTFPSQWVAGENLVYSARHKSE